MHIPRPVLLDINDCQQVLTYPIFYGNLGYKFLRRLSDIPMNHRLNRKF
jgi:hypothetical protein